MTFVDHLFVLLLFVVQPVYGYLSFRRLRELAALGQAPSVVSLYLQNMALQWGALTVLLVTWIWLGRSFADLGFVRSNFVQWAIGGAVVAAISAVLVYSWIVVRRMNAAERAEQRASIADFDFFLPRTERDLRAYLAMSVTAGIVEEVIFRAFVYWYLAYFMPLWAVVAVSSVAFGLGHAYQGLAGIAKVVFLGGGFGLLYILTGSIWLPILCHVLVDAIQGFSIVEVRRDEIGGDDGALAER